jgi:4-hydroxy-tetrahydrodipicolinate reductase
MPVRVCIAGVAGRMGQRLIALTREDTELQLAGGTERTGHPSIGQDLGRLVGGADSGLQVLGDIDRSIQADVLIDFTSAESSVRNAALAAERGWALVIGTTGLTPDQKQKLEGCAKKAPMIFAPNFSVGVNVLFKAAAIVAKALGPGYEIEIVEAHHDKKADAPSGTALGLAESIAGALNRDLKTDAVYGRQGAVGPRKPNEIGIHAVRMGDVVGEHTAYFAIGGERLELTHRASSRDTFARGALRAAKWLMTPRRPNGMYTMAQVLGLE